MSEWNDREQENDIKSGESCQHGVEGRRGEDGEELMVMLGCRNGRCQGEVQEWRKKLKKKKSTGEGADKI